MVKLVALVFYENDFFNLHATLTAVNLHLKKINRKIINGLFCILIGDNLLLRFAVTRPIYMAFLA